MKKRSVSILLVLALALGLAAPSLAAGPSFTDVPESYWGYADIEAVAQAGYMNGTGNGAFSPEMKVSVAQFLTLLGRLVFPDVKTEGADWFGPYVAAAQEAGLLTGSQVDVNNVEAEISRYDMAVILRAAAKKLGVAEKAAQSSEVADYLDTPARYVDAVLAVYGMGLIKGDQAGNFNGGNTMMRAEVATVIMRLAKAKPGGNTTTEPEKPTETEKPTNPMETPPPAEPKFISQRVIGWVQYNSKGDPQNNGIGVVGIPVELRYTEDNGTTYTVIETATTMERDGGNSPGRFDFTIQIEKGLYDRHEAGEGQFYFSTEATVNGQHYVTQDRRTDGKATIIPVTDWLRSFVDLVPPDRGETTDITVTASVIGTTYFLGSDGRHHMNYYSDGLISGDYVLTNSTVKIYFDPQQEGVPRVLIGETTADGGSIHDTIPIDTAYYRATGAYYVVEIEAVLDGQLCTNINPIPHSMSELTGKDRRMLWKIQSKEYYEASLNP